MTQVNFTRNDFRFRNNLCTDVDALLVGIEEYKLFTDGEWLAPLGRFMIWEGGLAWNIVFFGSMMFITTLFALAIPTIRESLRRKKIESQTLRIGAQINVPRKTERNFTEWLLAEEKTGKGGATFISFQCKLVRVLVFAAVVCSALVPLHWNGNKLEESEKSINSTTIENIGLIGVHAVILVLVLFWQVIPGMKEHGIMRGLNALPSHEVKNKSNYYNMNCLVIRNIPVDADITEEEIAECLKNCFAIKRSDGEPLRVTHLRDVSKLEPAMDEHKYEVKVLSYYQSLPEGSDRPVTFSICELLSETYHFITEDVLSLLWQHLNRLFKRQVDREAMTRFRKFTLIQFLKGKVYEYFGYRCLFERFSKFFEDCETGLSYHMRREAYLREELRLMKVSFSGMVIVHFENETQTRAAKTKLRNYILIKNLWESLKIANVIRSIALRIRAERSGPCIEPDKKLRVHEWQIEYAPQPKKINWRAVKPMKPWWRRTANSMFIVICFILYVIVMAAPRMFLRQLLNDSDEGDKGWFLIFKVVFVPAVTNFFARFFTDSFVDWLWDFNKNVTTTRDMARRFWFHYLLEFTLNIVRMLSNKPLLEILFELPRKNLPETSDELPPMLLDCLFYPVHTVFLANSIVTNAASSVLMDLLLIASVRWPKVLLLWNDLKPSHKFHDRAEKEIFLDNSDMSYDVGASYAEIVCDFTLTIGFCLVFPLLGPVAFVCALLRMFSCRAVVKARTANKGHNIHRAAVDGIILGGFMGPIALTLFRFVQYRDDIGSLDVKQITRFACPVTVLICYTGYVLYCVWCRRGNVYLWSVEPPERDPGVYTSIPIEEENLYKQTENAYDYFATIGKYISELDGMDDVYANRKKSENYNV